MIQAVNISKHFGAQTLFEEASFTIGDDEKIGLIGRNGTGKSTLFRILAGLDELDTGEIVVPKGVRIGYVGQQLRFTERTILAEACLKLTPNDDGSVPVHRAEAALQGLGFDAADFSRDPAELAGGYQVRLNLASVLVAESELLLLDEPTNYLDIVALRWLARFLRSWRGAFMLITHDRDFMDSVTSHSMIIHRARIRKMPGGSIKLWNQIATEEEVVEQTRRNLEKKREQVEEFIDRFRAKASKAKAVQSRIKALERMDMPGELAAIADLRFSFSPAPFTGRFMIEAEDLSYAYDAAKPPLFAGLTFSLKHGDRVAVIGKNGKGKSTLLQILAGEREPHSGRVGFAANLQRAYFGQTNVERLNPANTVEQEVLAVEPNRSLTAARTACGVMMFEGEQALKSVAVLSGGERSRVLLAKLLLTPANLLLLDEPANHLDMPSAEALLAAVSSFSGAVIMVAHSESMLREFANRLIVFREDNAFLFEGTYDDFLRRIGWGDETEKQGGDSSRPGDAPDRRELRRLRAELINRRSRETKPLERRIGAIETKIMKLEDLMKTEEEEMITASQSGQGVRVGELMRLHDEHGREIEALFDELEHQSALLKEAQQKFEAELAALQEPGSNC